MITTLRGARPLAPALALGAGYLCCLDWLSQEVGALLPASDPADCEDAIDIYQQEVGAYRVSDARPGGEQQPHVYALPAMVWNAARLGLEGRRGHSPVCGA